MNIGDTSGVELAAALRQSVNCASTPMLLLTSADQPHDVANTPAVNGFLVKPVGQQALLESIRRVIGLRINADRQPAAPSITTDAGGAWAANTGGGRQSGQSEAGAAPARETRPHADSRDQRP
jgi:DNA-binding NarL/FixJ family response regulator